MVWDMVWLMIACGVFLLIVWGIDKYRSKHKHIRH